MGLLSDIPEGSLVALDTVVWIYEVEAHPTFGPIVHEFFRDGLDAGRNRAGSSLLTLGELLVRPLSCGRQDLAERYCQVFVSGAGLDVWEVTRGIVERAADLRARYRVKMLDALHLAAAMENRAGVFLSNDTELRRVREIKVLTLSDYLGTAGAA